MGILWVNIIKKGILAISAENHFSLHPTVKYVFTVGL